jgi:predicted transcriptional regulator
MSLKPQFADEVLTGQKKCEVRTFMGTISKGSIVLVYYSSPVRLVRDTS